MPTRPCEPCLPTSGSKVPARGRPGAAIHQERPRLDGRYPRIVHAALKNRSSSFDILAADAEDLRQLPLSMRKANLARLLARRPDGIFVAPFEQGEIGPDLFRKACEFEFQGPPRAQPH
jgi:hypothetical protein